ncbi:hypothetical protein E3E22_03540 [Thermococcus sp. MV5]|uniref:hypothetical protein n=1 Tax=Thermococcus sp. MV5 TaxID=1638272 RepID=UPI00143C748B|nr:hypothetical protein [Thermococcus sp. MV5]NJE25709.1 hypothetical protein [Thermococcus sp. MV5]
MKIGISELDEILGEIEEGNVLLLETIGTLGEEVVLEMLKENKENAVAFVTKKMRDRFREIPELTKLKLIVLGEDVFPAELYAISFKLRNLFEGAHVGFFLLHPLLVFHSPTTVYKFFSEIALIVQEKKVVLTAIIDKRLVDERILAMFENLATYVIDIVEVVEGFKIRRGIRVKKSPKGGTGFYKFEIRNGKLVIGEPIE